MIVRKANCPACGGEVRFDLRSSVMTICPHCRSAVARGDQKLEDLGKVADLAETNTPLHVGLTGRYGLAFRLTGRVQLKHSSGAVWDEWCASFTDGRVGWLAEAQGRYFLTFPSPLGPDYPRLEGLRVGEEVPGLGLQTRMVVNEVNRGTFVAGEGEIPFRIEPGKEYYFADLSGEQGAFGTLDYSQDPPLFFLGTQLALEQLGIRPLGEQQAVVEKAAAAVKVDCPNCGGKLELRAPDQSERVGCPYCGALLEAKKGALAFLQALKPPKFKPALPLGATGVFENVPQMVIGFLVRSTVIEGERYLWEEYLLYHPRTGFRWLVRSDDHWTYVKAVEPGAIREQGGGVVFQGKAFRRYQSSTAIVEHVVGEVYWQVTAGERVAATDYSCPPVMLSKEVTLAPGADEDAKVQAGEVNWSLGEYVKPEEIEKKFRLPNRLPRPTEDHPCRAAGSPGWVVGVIVAIVVVILIVWIVSEIEDEGGGGSHGRTGIHFGGGK